MNRKVVRLFLLENNMKRKIKNVQDAVTPDPKEFIDDYLMELIRCIMALDKEKIVQVIDVLVEAYKNDKKVFILGNGGSASAASHMACDLSKGTLQRIYDTTEKRFRVISLTDNGALITALANDISFEDIFVQQLRNLIEKGDVVIALSGSGNSQNVIKALEYAKESGAKTVGILGFRTGGKAGKIVDYSIIADSDFYGPIEDLQSILNHLIAAWLAKIKKFHDRTVGLESENKAVPFRS